MYIYIYVYLGSISSLMQISLNIIDILCLHIFFWIRSNSPYYFYSNGSKRKYVDIKCLLCLMKFALTKKCCLNIHILNFMILQLINITALWNTDVISWRDKLQLCSRSSLMMAQSRAESTEGYMQLWTIHKSIPPEYNKSNTGIRTDPKENM